MTTLVGYILRKVPADRADYRTTLTDERARTAAEAARADAAEARAGRYQAEIDEEREKRRDAETAAASASAQLMALQQMSKWLREDRRAMAEYLPPPIMPGVLPDPPPRPDQGST